MQTLASESTADQLLDYLASDGRGAEWTRYADLADWETLYNLLGQRGFIGRLARDLAGRGRADVRRAGEGMQLRLTLAGIARAGQREAGEKLLVADYEYRGTAHTGGFVSMKSRKVGRFLKFPARS